MFLQQEYDTRMFHMGCPVLVGHKWVLTKWLYADDQGSIHKNFILRKPICEMWKADRFWHMIEAAISGVCSIKLFLCNLLLHFAFSNGIFPIHCKKIGCKNESMTYSKIWNTSQKQVDTFGNLLSGSIVNFSYYVHVTIVLRLLFDPKVFIQLRINQLNSNII